MKPGARLLVLGFASVAFLISGCEWQSPEKENSSSGPIVTVTVSGVLTYDGWTQGEYYALLYPDGTPIGDPGWLVKATITVSATSTAYGLPTDDDTGDVYVFGFNDENDDGGPSGSNDGAACSAVFTVKGANVENVDITLVSGGTFPGCPL